MCSLEILLPTFHSEQKMIKKDYIMIWTLYKTFVSSVISYQFNIEMSKTGVQI